MRPGIHCIEASVEIRTYLVNGRDTKARLCWNGTSKWLSRYTLSLYSGSVAIHCRYTVAQPLYTVRASLLYLKWNQQVAQSLYTVRASLLESQSTIFFSYIFSDTTTHVAGWFWPNYVRWSQKWWSCGRDIFFCCSLFVRVSKTFECRAHFVRVSKTSECRVHFVRVSKTSECRAHFVRIPK